MTVLQDVKKAIEIEAAAVKALAENVGPEFEEAIKLIQNCTGKVIVTGVGKSGHVGKKIAASLASKVTPEFYVHSTEGDHGDTGMHEEIYDDIMLSTIGVIA